MSGSPIVGNIALSLQAKDVCESHFFGGRGCGKCPIITACHSSRPQEPMDDWRKRVNDAAAAAISKATGEAA